MTLAAGVDLVIQAPQVLREDLDILRLMTGAQGVEPIDRAACEAYRLHEPEDRAGVAEACAAAEYDFAFVPHERTLDRVRLVAMDMDSTLITIECIDEIAAMHGIGGDVAAITAAAMRGEIDFTASLTRRVALLEGLPIEALARVYDERLRLSPGAPRLFEALQAIGAKTLLVSGGFTFFTERLQARLGIDFTLSNALDVDNGRLTGRLRGDIVDAQAKASCFSTLAQRYARDGLGVAIGDGANDLPMLAAADVSIAYHARPRVREQATHAIDHCGLDAVLNLFS
ncbi:MAG TPA: phosphoserine phosphatase SerB [Casimicrobiaceae bacterium]|nr:phosphoserine phosphatase SerB [Casimicrobiaceae bacterium]